MAESNINLSAAMANLPQPGDAPIGPTGYSNPGAVSVQQVPGGAPIVTRHGVAPRQQATDAPTGTALFTSLRDHRYHSPVHVSEATGETIVTMKGGPGEMKLSSAIAAGYVERDANGQYVAGPELRRGL